MKTELIRGDCLVELKKLKNNSVDAVVTDPPAGISFMGKAWDSDKGGRDNWIKWMSEIASECNRILRPGGHALVWSIPRTSHWTGMAWENAGFEPRDVIAHIFGSGFPKSLSIGKSINKLETAKGTFAWEGYGTALKPAREDWWLLRKPLEKGLTIAENCLKWGVGGLNIDGCRVDGGDGDKIRKGGATMKDKTVQVRLELEIYDKAKRLAIEGNVSMWIRLLIKKEIEKKESEA